MIKLVCFDLNKTLIEENSWYNLNLAMGVTKGEDEELFKKYEIGEISYTKWQEILLDIYKKRGKATRENIYNSILNYKFKRGANELVKYLQNKDYALAIISGSMNILADNVAKKLRIPRYGVNNIFKFNSDGYLKDLKVLGDDKVVKLKQLKQFCLELEIKTTECACIGDGDNDIKIFRETKHGITFNGSKIEKYAWKVVNNLVDIKDIL